MTIFQPMLLNIPLHKMNEALSETNGNRSALVEHVMARSNLTSRQLYQGGGSQTFSWGAQARGPFHSWTGKESGPSPTVSTG